MTQGETPQYENLEGLESAVDANQHDVINRFDNSLNEVRQMQELIGLEISRLEESLLRITEITTSEEYSGESTYEERNRLNNSIDSLRTLQSRIDSALRLYRNEERENALSGAAARQIVTILADFFSNLETAHTLETNLNAEIAFDSETRDVALDDDHNVADDHS